MKEIAASIAQQKTHLLTNEVVSIAKESIVREKVKHIANGAAAMTAGASGTIWGDILGWLPHLAVLASIMASFMIFYKTYRELKSTNLDIELKKLKLSKEGRRESDKVAKEDRQEP